MHVEMAEERVLVLTDRFSMDHAEGRAWTKRIEAFGTMAKLTGFLSRPRDEEFAVVYRERRLQPFWHLACTGLFDYERARDYKVPVDANVTEVRLDGQVRAVADRAFTLAGVEHCRDEVHRDCYFDAVGGAPEPALAAYRRFDATVADAERLQAETAAGAVVVPPQAKASMLVRDVLAGAITRIEADTVKEEKVSLTHVDLYYRPVYAFRYRWQGKEAVVEFDGLTGEARPGGETFEQFIGKRIDAHFLLNAGVEAAGLFIPGARLAEIVISKSLKAARPPAS